MSLLAVRIGVGVLALLALITLRGKRWAYVAFVGLGLLYLPAQAHFHVHAPKCEQILPTMHQLVLSLHSYAYIALFAGFYWISWVQFQRFDWRPVWALVATLLAGALVEVAQGMTGQGHCRLRELVPDAAGALGAALLLAIWSRLRRKPAYVRIVKPRPAGAPPLPATAPRAVVPPRGVAPPPPPPPPPPPLPPGLPPGMVLPPADFSPGPVTSSSQVAPTQQVVSKAAQRLRTILGRLRGFLHRIWVMIVGRRRTIVVGVVLLALVGAGAIVLSRLPAPPVVVEQPKAPEPPPPPPRPLQAEVEGFYEPSYKFTVADRRFIRLTLRPEVFVTFARTGTRQEVGCADARISADAVHLRCEFERVGMVTIEGRFASRYATDRLDMPALSAVVTVTNTRGEVLYRARDSFRWHTPD